MPTPNARHWNVWAPPIWSGCDAFAWARLLAANRFAVHWSRLHIAAGITVASVVNTAIGLAQRATDDGRAARTPIYPPPLFVLGHWRTGTTFLHDLLAEDPRHAFPTTYDCFSPHSFRLTRDWVPRLIGWLMPDRRPMDNVTTSFERPQEDEFALILLGQPSPYERLAFPNRPAAGASALDLRGLSRPARQRWKAELGRFAREVACENRGRRLVFKSPPHTCRIPVLLELFPDARFVHIVRDPYVVYPSTLHLWRVVFAVQGLQRPSWGGLSEYILDTFTQMYDGLEEGKKLIPPGRFCELRYEDLVDDPIGQLADVYRKLALGDFESARPHVAAYLAGLKGYETNRYFLTAEERRSIALRWGPVIRRYGYADPVE
jgi:omega-hydroxy-beta-dihydromenaquinone-9 sulfotransferase